MPVTKYRGIHMLGTALSSPDPDPKVPPRDFDDSDGYCTGRVVGTQQSADQFGALLNWKASSPEPNHAAPCRGSRAGLACTHIGTCVGMAFAAPGT